MEIDNKNEQVSPSPQPVVSPTPENQQKKILLIIGVVVALLIFGVGGYVLGTRKNTVNSSQPVTTLPTNTIQPTSVDQQLMVTEKISVPFAREGNIYLYEDGKENIIASSQQKSTFEARYDNAYPFLSPNGKYLAYIAFTGGGGLDPQGTLKIYNTETRETKTTQYKTGYFQWNSFNQLEFKIETNIKPASGEGIDPAQSKVTYIVVDPESLQQLASQIMSYDDLNNAGIGGFPLYSNKKAITFKSNSYYLVNKQNNTEKLLFQKGEIYQFSGWSPDGTYIIFLGAKQNPYKTLWISVNANDPNLSQTEIKIKDLAGGAGGDASTGLKWYFNKGFVMYCMQSIFFVDGRDPLELTHTGGGGCHNEEGFVATSPNGEYAFVKFDDRFELHTKSGEKKTINESTPIQKTRSTPKNLIWINNDYMLIYESTFSGSVIGESSASPRIFLFDRKANTIKPIINNAYLSTFAVGIP